MDTPTDHAPNRDHVLLVGWRSASARAMSDQGVHLTVLASTAHLGAARSSRADRVIEAIDPCDVELCLSALDRAGIQLSEFAAVCSGSEFTLVPAAVLAQLGGCRGLAVGAAIALRDKHVQKRRVRDRGVRVAESWIVDGASDTGRLPSGDFVIKPLAGAGAADTHRLAGPNGVARYLADPVHHRRPWLLESFIEGREVQIDGVIRGGTVLFLAVSRYLQNLIEVHAGGLVGAILLPPEKHAGLYEDAYRLVGEALEALGHTDGVFHLEAFIAADGLVFSECAGRVSGGMADEAIRRVFGVDIHREWANAALGRPASVDPIKTDLDAAGDIYLSLPAGVVRSVPTTAEFAVRPGVLQSRIDVVPGDVVTHDPSTGTDHRAATVLVGGASEEEVEGRMLDLTAWFAGAAVSTPD